MTGSEKFICKLPLRSSQRGFQFSNLKPRPLRPHPLPSGFPAGHILSSFCLPFFRPLTRPSGTLTAPPPPSDAVFSPLPFCADEYIVVVVNASAVSPVVALVDKVVVLVSLCGGKCHAFLFRRCAPASPPLLLPPPLLCAGESAASGGYHCCRHRRGSH